MLDLNTNLSILNEFQAEVIDIIKKLLIHLIPDVLSDRSYFDPGPIPDCILRNNSDLELIFSIQKDELRINSKYFDIYSNAQEPRKELKLLCKEILLGNYITYLRYAEDGRFIEKQTIFDHNELHKYKEVQGKLWLLRSKPIVAKEEAIKGFRWIKDFD